MKKLFVCALFFALAHCKTGNQGNSAADKLRAEILDAFKKENGGKFPSERMASGEANPADAAFVELKDFLFSGDFTDKLNEGAETDNRTVRVPGGDVQFRYHTGDLKLLSEDGEGQSPFDQYMGLYKTLSSKNFKSLIPYEEAIKKSKPMLKTPESLLNNPEYRVRDEEDKAIPAYLLDYYSVTLYGEKYFVVAYYAQGKGLGVNVEEDTPEERAEFFENMLKPLFGIESLEMRSQGTFQWHTLENLELKSAVEFCRNDARFEVKVDLPRRAYILAGGNIFMSWPVFRLQAPMGGMGGAGGPRHENNDANDNPVDGDRVDDAAAGAVPDEDR